VSEGTGKDRFIENYRKDLYYILCDISLFYYVCLGGGRRAISEYFILRINRIGNSMTFAIVYPKDIESLRIEKRAILIDIRSRGEYREGHWEGAINYPEEEIEDYTKVLGRRRRLILYCGHGGASMQVARILGKQGYEVGTVVGGYDAMKKYKEPKK